MFNGIEFLSVFKIEGNCFAFGYIKKIVFIESFVQRNPF